VNAGVATRLVVGPSDTMVDFPFSSKTGHDATRLGFEVLSGHVSLPFSFTIDGTMLGALGEDQLTWRHITLYMIFATMPSGT
jgi:hypothetical protein